MKYNNVHVSPSTWRAQLLTLTYFFFSFQPPLWPQHQQELNKTRSRLQEGRAHSLDRPLAFGSPFVLKSFGQFRRKELLRALWSTPKPCCRRRHWWVWNCCSSFFLSPFSSSSSFPPTRTMPRRNTTIASFYVRLVFPRMKEKIDHPSKKERKKMRKKNDFCQRSKERGKKTYIHWKSRKVEREKNNRRNHERMNETRERRDIRNALKDWLHF